MKSEVGHIELRSRIIKDNDVYGQATSFVLVVCNTKTHKRVEFGYFHTIPLAEHFAKEHKIEVSYE